MSSVCPPGTSWDDASQWCRPDAYGDPENPNDPTDPSGCPPGTHYQQGQGCIPGTGGGGSGSDPNEARNACINSGGHWMGGTCAYGGGGTPGGGYSGFELPKFGGSFRPDYEDPPGFDAPDFSYPDFVAPKPEDIYKDPSYQWRLDQGRKSLERSAAARGVTRSGGTLTGILEYGQNFGANEYNNIFDRALTTYTTNRGTALDVFDRLYQGAKDEYAPKLLGWQTRMENSRIARQREWEDYWRRIDDAWRRENAVLQYGAA